MNYKEVLECARERGIVNCRVCEECNGLGCGNIIPGPGSKAPGNGAHENWKAWREIYLNLDTIGPDIPSDTSCELFGRRLALPLISAPIGSLRVQFDPTDDVREYNDACIAACYQKGILACFGSGRDASVVPRGLESGKRHGNVAIPVINPYPTETILGLLEQINQAEPAAVSLVIDSVGLPHAGKKANRLGAKTIEELKQLKSAAKVPLIIKGIMTGKGAEKAIEAGADAIVVSNHGGRALSDAAPTAVVLPEIAAAARGSVRIIVDGGIRSGMDLFKALALGADAAMVCRPFMISWFGAGQEGIEAFIDKIQAELAETMYMCGARTVREIREDMVRRKGAGI